MSGATPKEVGDRIVSEVTDFGGTVASGLQFVMKMMQPESMLGYTLWGGIASYGITRGLIKYTRRNKLQAIKRNILGVLGISERLKLQYVGHIIATQAQYPAVDYKDLACISAVVSPLLLSMMLPRLDASTTLRGTVSAFGGMATGLIAGTCAALYVDYRRFIEMTADYMS
jgi:hypothetical protein